MTRRHGVSTLLFAAILFASGCAMRAPEVVTARTTHSPFDGVGAVVLTLPDRVLWETPLREDGPHGFFHAGPILDAYQRKWSGYIEARLRARGMRLTPSELIDVDAMRRVIEKDDYAARANSTLVLQVGRKGKAGSANGGGTRFLSRPFVFGPGKEYGSELDFPILYDLSPLKERGVSYAVLVDLPAMTLIGGDRDAGTGVTPGFAAFQLAVVDLQEYRVVQYVDLEHPARDESRWIFGDAIETARLSELRKGRLDGLIPAFDEAGPNLADLVEYHLGFIDWDALQTRKASW